MGCNTCHVTHKTGKHGTQEFDYHLVKAAPELCIGCHDPKDAGVSKPHNGQPFEKAACTRCHDPHESNSPKLMQKFVHVPFTPGACDSCHQPAKDGKVVLTQPNAKSLCVTCHDGQAKQIETAKVQHPGAQGDCTDCHNPHAGKSPQFLQPNRVAVCEACHTNEAEIHDTKRVLHDPVYKQGCDVCHLGHGGEREHLIRAETNELCLNCHDPKKAPAKVADSTDITIFDGAVQLPGNYFDNISLLRLDSKGFGHPQLGHPVGGMIDPSDPEKVKKITCVRCHNPHGGGKSLLAVGEGTSKSLCSQCHSNLRTIPIGDATPVEKKKKGKR
jgi:predicted CXXCH cytochrome family protein